MISRTEKRYDYGVTQGQGNSLSTAMPHYLHAGPAFRKHFKNREYYTLTLSLLALAACAGDNRDALPNPTVSNTQPVPSDN